jgi:hypothetical protein
MEMDRQNKVAPDTSFGSENRAENSTRGAEPVNAFTYDVTAEADEDVKFHGWNFLEEWFILSFFPFSFIYLLCRYDVESIRTMHFLPPPKEKRSGAPNTKHIDPEEQRFQMSAGEFFNQSTFITMLRLFAAVSYVPWKVAQLSACDQQGACRHSKAPDYSFRLFMFVNVMMSAAQSFKKAFRKKSSLKRLESLRERRNEELLWGWLPMPWWLIIFELRIAARQVGANLKTGKFLFKDATPDQLRAALGERVTTLFSSFSNEPCVESATGDYAAPEGKGAYCSAMAVLLRAALEESYVHPADAKDVQVPWLFAHLKPTYILMCLPLCTAPIWVEAWIGGDGIYDVAGVICCLSCFFFNMNYVAVVPQGWMRASLLTIKRRTRMLEFLNDVLPRREHANEEQRRWLYSIDMTFAQNIDMFRHSRELLMAFGELYKQRCDGIAALAFIYLTTMTALLILVTAILSDPIEFKGVALMVVVHFFFVALLGMFAIKLALQGEAFTSVIHDTKVLLANAMIQVESEMALNSKRTRFSMMTPTSESEDIESTLRRYESARMAALHLQECLSASKEINSCELLGIFPLDKSAVSGIFFSMVTQVTLVFENMSFEL